MSKRRRGFPWICLVSQLVDDSLNGLPVEVDATVDGYPTSSGPPALWETYPEAPAMVEMNISSSQSWYDIISTLVDGTRRLISPQIATAPRSGHLKLISTTSGHRLFAGMTEWNRLPIWDRFSLLDAVSICIWLNGPPSFDKLRTNECGRDARVPRVCIPN